MFTAKSLSHLTLATLLAMCAAGLLLFASTDSALAESLISQSWTACKQSARNSGGNDAAGRVYIACGGNKILVYSAAGAPLQQVDTSLPASDVAPSSDGEFLYTANGNNAPRRLNRQPDGSYVVDTHWRLASYPLYDVQTAPRGHYIDTDSAGNVYLSDGSYTEGPGEDGVNRDGGMMTIVKYSAAGRFITRFGVWGRDLAMDHFLKLDGIAVTTDGSSVYAADTGPNSRMLRFDRQANGTYAPSQWKIGNSPSYGDCIGSGADAYFNGTLASPYDLDLDSDGNLWILNTSCHEVTKFRTNGTLIASIRTSNDSLTQRPHGFAVARDGSRVFMAQSNKIVRDPSRANGSTPCGGETTCDFDGEKPVHPPVDPGSDPSDDPEFTDPELMPDDPEFSDPTPTRLRVLKMIVRKGSSNRRRVTVHVNCNREGKISLTDGKGRSLARTMHFECRSSSAQQRFVLGARAIKHLRRADGVIVATAKSGNERSRLRSRTSVD